MAITTYSELKDAIANWSARADLASGGANVNRVDEIIDNAEAMFNRDLRTRDMETKNASFVINGEYVAVPTDFLEARSLYLNTSPKRSVAFLPDDQQSDWFGSGTGIPRFVSVDGSNFRFGPVPDGTYTGTLLYYAKVPALSTSTTGNWLLSSHPDLYLAACQMWTSVFIRDAEGLANWRAAYQQLAASLSGADNRSRWGANGMAVRAG